MVEYFAKTFAHNSGVCHYVIRRAWSTRVALTQRDKFLCASRVWVTGSLEAFAEFVAGVFSGEIADPGTRDRRKTFRRKHGWSAGKVHSMMPEHWWDDAALERDGYRRMDI